VSAVIDSGGKKMGRSEREEAPQKRWFKGNSGRHFANDTRLADALEDPAQRAGCQRNDANREYPVFCVHPLSSLEPRHSD
jgi:hypothetical protein